MHGRLVRSFDVAIIVVVGAGMGGMAAAARLSAQGHAVCVVEQSATYGGKLGSYERDGFRFDTGPSLLTLPAVYRDLFLKTAVRRKDAALEDNVGLNALDPAFSYQWADGTRAVLPGSNTNRIAHALDDALGNAAGSDWKRFSQRAAAMWAATRVPFLESPISTQWQLVRQLGKISEVRTIAPWQSLRGLGEQYLHDSRLRMLLDRYATYSGSDPRRAPAALAVIPYVEQTFGAWHIEGGLRALATALHDRCVDREIEFRFNCPVRQITTRSGSVTGVVLANDEFVRADVVVANADATVVYRDLLDVSGSKPLRRLQRATPSLSGFVLLLAIAGRTSGLGHHNVLFPESYDAEFDAIFGRDPRPVDDPTIYICSPDDRLMRPDAEHESWFVLVNAPRHQPGKGVDWRTPATVETYREHVFDVMAARGLDIRSRVVWQHTRTPADLEDATGAPGGSIYGTSSNGRRAAFLRPANQSPVSGLFLVGGSAHPGGGLPLVGMSAAIVSQLIGSA